MNLGERTRGALLFVRLGMSSGFLLAAACGPAARPNILLYVSDTLRADGLGCYGNSVVETPNVDRLAREGVLFERAIAPSSWTRPAMASILSGTYPAVHGAQGRTDLLGDSVVLMSELLKDAGYATCNVVTNPNVGTGFGFRQGYEVEDFIELYEDGEALDGEGEIRTVKVEELVTTADQATRAAIAWLETAPEPFFLLVHSIDPHSPYTPPEVWDRYGTGIASDADGSQTSLWQLGRQRTPADVARTQSLYFGEIAFNDDAFGELVEWLRERGTWDRTIAVFTSDHGEEFWELGERGHGKTLNEKSLHVPLILRYPPVLAGPERPTRIVTTVDVLPTVFALAGLDTPDWIEGRSLLEDRDQTVFASCNLQKVDLHAARRGDFKLVLDRESGRRWLHDVSRGTEGQRNLVEHRSDLVDELSAELAAHMAHESARRIVLHASERAPRIDEADLEPHIRDELENLGYFDGDEPQE